MEMLKEGSKGPEVKRLQGLLGVSADGMFGPATKKAVVRFQLGANISADGIVGNETWTLLLTRGPEREAIDEDTAKELINRSKESLIKMKEDTSENVEFAIKLQGDVLVPVDSHFPVEKFKAITDGHDAEDKRLVADARAKLATAFKAKAKSVNEKYIVPPKTTDFAIVYAPTESLYKELTEYQDPSTKELLTQELMKKYKVVICGPNTLSAYLQSLHMGFQSLKVQKGATEIYNHLKTISTRFSKHFDNIVVLRKKLEDAMSVVDKFGTDARSINRTLESIKDPEQVEKAVQTDNVEKFVDKQRQIKN